MTQPAARDRFTTRTHRGTYLACYLVIFGVALRRLAFLDNLLSIGLAVFLLAAFTLLFAFQPRLARKHPQSLPAYFATQFVIVQSLAAFRPYLDTWALLYIVLGVQVIYHCARPMALRWGGIFAFATLLTLVIEFGGLSGAGRALAYLINAIFLLSFDTQYARHADAHAESQLLLEELRAAHARLQAQAVQAEQLAAARERERITQEVHDSVGQKIFAIQLLAESACVLLATDPPRATAQLNLLQEQTQTVLSQMRQWIDRWRLPPASPHPADGDPRASLPLAMDP